MGNWENAIGNHKKGCVSKAVLWQLFITDYRLPITTSVSHLFKKVYIAILASVVVTIVGVIPRGFPDRSGVGNERHYPYKSS
jgi:hypothetical protein